MLLEVCWMNRANKSRTQLAYVSVWKFAKNTVHIHAVPVGLARNIYNHRT